MDAIRLLRQLTRPAPGEAAPTLSERHAEAVIRRMTPESAAGVIVTAHDVYATPGVVVAGDAYERIISAARAMTGGVIDEAAPGVTFEKTPNGEVVNFGRGQFFDLVAARFPGRTTGDLRQVELVYAPDGDWSQTRRLTLATTDADGTRFFQGRPKMKNDATGRAAKTLEYCLKVTDAEGQVHWINNGNKPDHTPLNYLHVRNGGVVSQLLAFATSARSPGGKTFTNGEMSAFAEQATWQTRAGDQTLSDGELRGLRNAVEKTRADVGADGFEVGILDALQLFGAAPHDTLPYGYSLNLVGGALSLEYTMGSTSDLDVERLHVRYSTDGGNSWTNAGSSEQVGGGRGGPERLRVFLGQLPPETPIRFEVEAERRGGTHRFSAWAPAPWLVRRDHAPRKASAIDSRTASSIE